MFSLLALTAAAAAALFSPSAHAATICNGSPELCTRRYSSVTFIGAHNSYAVGSNVADNQYKDVTAQLNDGVRTLQIQAHSASDGVRLCHGSCTFRDAGLIGDYLGKVAGWVGAHPTEVVSMVIVNSNNVPATTFASAFSAAGLDQYAFTPSAGQLTLSEWPTLGSMIDSGRRVVVFIDNQANFAQVPYLIDEFSNMWEDAYNAVDQTFGCAVNRSRAAPAQSLMLINHYLDYTGSIAGTQFFLPDKDRLNQTNAASGQGSIGYHVGNCAQIWGRNPNHILLDFYDSNGNVPFTLAAQLNGVTLQSPAAVTPFTQTARVTGAPSGGSSGSAGGVGGANNAAVTQSRLSGAERVGGSGVGPAAAAVAMAMVMGVAGVMLGAGMV